MFYECNKLISFDNYSENLNYNIKIILSMNYMLKNCLLLKSLPALSKWNIDNSNYMISLFYGCSLLITLPNISGLNTKNVYNLEYLFYRCSSLKILPDISKWNIDNVNNI